MRGRGGRGGGCGRNVLRIPYCARLRDGAGAYHLATGLGTRSYAIRTTQYSVYGRSVLNGDAGSPAALARFGSACSCQPKRTWTGFATCGLETTTVLPSMRASAGTNFLSAPAMVKWVSGLP